MISYLLYEKKRIFVVWMLSFAYAIILLIPAFLISTIIDLAVARNVNSYLTFVAIELGFTYILIAVIKWLTSRLITNVKASINKKLSKDTYKAVLELPYERWGTVSKEHLYQVCIEDVNAIDVIGVEKVLEVVVYFVSAVGALIYIGSVYWPCLVVLCVIYCGYVVPTHVLGKQHVSYEQEARESTYVLRKEFVEIFQRIRLIRINRLENSEIQRFQKCCNRWGEAKYQLMQWYNIFKSIPRFLDAFAPAIIYLIGGYVVISGKISIGELVGITVLLPKVNAPIRYYSSYTMQIREAYAKLRDVYKIHCECLVPYDEEQKIDIAEITKIVFDNVTLKIDGKVILNNFSCQINKGQKIGITGPTGAGKSTFFLLLAGLIKIDSGNIWINDINMNEINMAGVRRQLCVMQQQPYLFQGTILDNSTKHEDIDANILKTWHTALELNEIEALDWEADIGDDGVRLSGGQKQLVGVTRLLASSKDLLLCDEITSGLDSLKRQRVLNNILEKKDKTVLFITHQLELLQKFDEIIVINDGEVLEVGSHESLMKKNGMYRELVNKYENKG